MLVGGDVLDILHLLQLFDESVGPKLQLVRGGVFQRVLILGAARAVVHGDVLHRLHEQLNPLNVLQLALQPADDVRRAQVAIGERLQIYRETSAVERGVGAIGSDERAQALDRWIGQDYLGQLFMLLRHGAEGDGLRRL